MNQTVMTHSRDRAEQPAFVASDFLLRIGGCPIDVVDSLRFELTARWACDVLDMEDRLGARQGALLDALHEAIREHAADKALQRELISL